MMGFEREASTDSILHIHGIREFGKDDNLVDCTHTIHKNLQTLLKMVHPEFAVLNDFPSFVGRTVPQCARGDYLEPRFALAGADFVAVDKVVTPLLGSIRRMSVISDSRGTRWIWDEGSLHNHHRRNTHGRSVYSNQTAPVC
jgi:hypothetical protein